MLQYLNNLNQNINILSNNNFTSNPNSSINNNCSNFPQENIFQPWENNIKNSLKTYKFKAEILQNNENQSSAHNKKKEHNKNNNPFNRNFNQNNSSSNNINNSNINNIVRSKFDEVENNFFFESHSDNNLRNNEEHLLCKDTQEQCKNNNFLLKAFQNHMQNPSNHNNQNFQGFYSANNTPWRSARGFNNKENFALNNYRSLQGFEQVQFPKPQIQFHTPENSPGRLKQNLPSNFTEQKRSNFQTKPNKASLFNNFEKEEKGDEFTDLEEMLGAIDCELWLYASSQKGSRNLQKLLNKILPHELDVILEKIKEHFSFLMTDTYGNYFCQKLIQCCSSEQRVFILKHVKSI